MSRSLDRPRSKCGVCLVVYIQNELLHLSKKSTMNECSYP